eukprot:690841-Pleurochrysis_carterae.AAC.1
MPAPTDVADIKGVSQDGETPMVRKSSDEEPFAALAFKIMTDPFVGTLTFVREPSLSTRYPTRTRASARTHALHARMHALTPGTRMAPRVHALAHTPNRVPRRTCQPARKPPPPSHPSSLCPSP